MKDSVAIHHPRVCLCFFAVGDIDSSLREQVTSLVEHLRGSRAWALGPPTLIDTAEPAQGDDEPIITVGGCIEMYSALSGTPLPSHIDRVHLEETEAIVSAVRGLSERSHCAFDFQLGNTYVGSIESGRLNKSLQVGLLDEWRAHMNPQ